MRTFGTDVDNLIDVELAYGTNDYITEWYQNGVLREIATPNVIVHFTGSKIPIGNVLKDYIEFETDYLDFLEEDAIRIDVSKEESTLTIGTFYIVPGYNKKTYSASYTAYSSLIDLGVKLDAWKDAPESADIWTIVHHFIDPIGITFEKEPLSTITFDASLTDFSNMTLQELLGYCAVIEKCNYKLIGNVLHKIETSNVINKKYNIDDVVYSENLTQRASDKVLDFIKVNYKTCTKTTEEDGEIEYDFSDVSYVCKDNTEKCGFDISMGLIPCSEDDFKALIMSYYQAIRGMDWNEYSITFLGDARVEIGDMLQFYNDRTSAVIGVAELTWNWDGALKCSVSSGTVSASADAGSGFNLSQIVSQIQAMGNALKNVQYNAVYATELYVKIAQMGYASIKELSAEVAKMGLMTVKEADIKYATIDFSNVKVESVGQLFADIGLLKDVTIVEGHITGYLSSVKINADVIEAGTLSVDRLLVTGKDSIVYQINVDSSGLSKEELADKKYQKYLNGTDIVANSITADQIAASTITANKLNISNIFGNEAVLSTLTSQEAFINAIHAETITASTIILGSIDNYCNLNSNTYKEYGFSVQTDTAEPNNPWFRKNLDSSFLENPIIVSPEYQCAGGETFLVKFDYSWEGKETGQTWTDANGIPRQPEMYPRTGEDKDISFGAKYVNRDGTTGEVYQASDGNSFVLPDTAVKFTLCIKYNRIYKPSILTGYFLLKNCKVQKAIGGKLFTGIIRSTNYAEYANGNVASGMKIDLSTGEIRSREFSLDDEGKVNITGGSILLEMAFGNSDVHLGVKVDDNIWSKVNYAGIENQWVSVEDGLEIEEGSYLIYNELRLRYYDSDGYSYHTAITPKKLSMINSGNGNESISLDGATGTITAVDLKTKAGVSLTTLQNNITALSNDLGNFKMLFTFVGPSSALVLSNIANASYIYVASSIIAILQIGNVVNVYTAYNTGSAFAVAPLIVNQATNHALLNTNSAGQLAIWNQNTGVTARVTLIYK